MGAGERLSAYTLGGRVPPRPDWAVGVRRANGMAISPDGLTLAMVDRAGELSLVDTGRGDVRRRINPPVEDPASDLLVSVAFSPDGSILAVGTRDQVRLPMSGLGRLPRPLVRAPRPPGALFALAFDEHGTRLAGADEKTVKVWDLARLRVELDHLGLGW